MTKMVDRPAVDREATASKAEPKKVRLVEKFSLKHHKDEVWDVCFSNDGTRLASSGADKNTIIYKVGSFDVLRVLLGHSGGIGCASWSPDDSKIVTCSQDNTARLWDTATGEHRQALELHFEGPVTSCSWLPSGQRFVTTSLNRNMSICLWSLNAAMPLNATLIHKFVLDDPMVPIFGSVLLPGTQRLASFDNQKKVYVHNLETKTQMQGSSSEVDLTSMCVSRLGKPFALFLRTDGIIEMIDVRTMEMVKVFKMKGYGQFVIKATFGGEGEEFVASGSEDGDVYVWKSGTGELLTKQKVHIPPASCNSVAWNPKRHSMIATAGDDHTVRILVVDEGRTT